MEKENKKLFGEGAPGTAPGTTTGGTQKRVGGSNANNNNNNYAQDNEGDDYLWLMCEWMQFRSCIS